MTNYDHVEAVVQKTLEDVKWTHKTQEKQADIYSNRYRWMEFIRIIAASLTSAGIIALFLKEDSFWLKLITALLSFATILIDTFFKSFDCRLWWLDTRKPPLNCYHLEIILMRCFAK